MFEFFFLFWLLFWLHSLTDFGNASTLLFISWNSEQIIFFFKKQKILIFYLNLFCFKFFFASLLYSCATPNYFNVHCQWYDRNLFWSEPILVILLFICKLYTPVSSINQSIPSRLSLRLLPTTLISPSFLDFDALIREPPHPLL